ncbi:MAG: phosphatidylglycerophosphatase A [Candidatus Aminicenantes bacterium]|nr:phosphatidylglycerophosphatase A [Candidatus Aminicenantes bacterium]
MKFIARVCATFFGLGFVPLAPGTAASLAAALLYKLFLFKLAWPVLFLLVFALALGGVPAASFYSRELGQKDPRRVVIDEAAGQLATLILVPPDWISVGSAFLLFRVFDILKPFPIRRIERLRAGWGIMADDLGAAFYARLVLQVVLLARGL